MGDSADEKERGDGLAEVGGIERCVREKIAGVIQRHQSHYEAPH